MKSLKSITPEQRSSYEIQFNNLCPVAGYLSGRLLLVFVVIIIIIPYSACILNNFLLWEMTVYIYILIIIKCPNFNSLKFCCHWPIITAILWLPPWISHLFLSWLFQCKCLYINTNTTMAKCPDPIVSEVSSAKCVYIGCSMFSRCLIYQYNILVAWLSRCPY